MTDDYSYVIVLDVLSHLLQQMETETGCTMFRHLKDRTLLYSKYKPNYSTLYSIVESDELCGYNIYRPGR